MDRFIGGQQVQTAIYQYHLKSNMDRFIAGLQAEEEAPCFDLKSNMDRFIGELQLRCGNCKNSFKIQYGQIYSSSSTACEFIQVDI